MRQKIENNLAIDVVGVDLTGATDLKLTVRQGMQFEETYVPTLVSSSEEGNVIALVIPYEDAMRLNRTECKLQLMFTRADGKPDASDPCIVDVDELIRRDGYGPA